jgi:hydroxyacylglutathione hydrolase
MADQVVVALRDEGLGNTSYLVDLGNGDALAVDPSRDLRALRTAARERGLRVAVVAETHLHADFLSGAVQLAADGGARIVASAAGDREFPHQGLRDEEEIDLGGLTLRALATPGHTGEHLSYELRDAARTLGVFTGGSLIVGGAARTDLVDPARTEELSRAQFGSLRRLAALPDEAVVWPTHGAGSFCTAGPADRALASTIAHERATNPLLRVADEDAFVAMMRDALGSFPPYFLRLAEENRRGPAVLPDRLSVPAVEPVPGLDVVDARPASAYAAGHPAGSLSIPLRPAFASWLGWLAPADGPVVVLRDPEQDLEEILWQAAKIGYTGLVGELAGGLTAWADAGLPVATTPLRPAFRSDDAGVIDVRQRAEYDAGHAPGAVNIELGQLAEQLPAGEGPLVLMCGHGERAMGAASILQRHGFEQVTVLDGGPQEWIAANGAEPAP